MNNLGLDYNKIGLKINEYLKKLNLNFYIRNKARFLKISKNFELKFKIINHFSESQ